MPDVPDRLSVPRRRIPAGKTETGDASEDWEMHCLLQPVIYEAFRGNGFSLLEVREDGALANGISQVFFALRERE